MTQTFAEPQSSSVASRLRDARLRAGLTLDAAAGATGLLRSYVAALETGRRRPLPGEVDRLSRAYGTDLSGLLPARRPIEVDADSITVAGQSRRLRDAGDEREVYATYLFLLYAVRGAAPGERISLRSSDVELLRQVAGDDPEQIEQRLVELMGCTPGEATMLRDVLLRHRAAAVGTAAALSWVAVAAPGAPDVAPVPAVVQATQLSGGTSQAAYYDQHAVDVEVPGPVEDALDGAWSPSYPGASEAGD